MTARRLAAMVLASSLASAWLAVGALPATGHIIPHPIGRGAPESLTLSSLGPGEGTTGFAAPAGFDPLAGYPATTPPGATPQNEGFAGIIVGSSSGGSVQLYCIDLNTNTWLGLSYILGSWNASNVGNVGFVARILNDYYPHTGEPAAAPVNVRAAAVQAAVWFFTDHYILDPSDPAYPFTTAIVAAVLAAGPLVQPTLPLALTGPTSGTVGVAAGPFDIATTAATVTVHVSGGSLFSDAAATQPIADGATIPASTHLWLVPSAPGPASISVSATITAPTGQVFLYDPADPAHPDPADAQRLILADEGSVTSTASAPLVVDPAPTPTPTPTGGVEPSGSSGSGGLLPTSGGHTPPATTTSAIPAGESSGGSAVVVALTAFSVALALDAARRRRRDRIG